MARGAPDSPFHAGPSHSPFTTGKETKEYRLYWGTFLAGPIAYTVQLLGGYMLVPYACNVAKWPLYALSLAAALACVVAALICFGSWRRSRDEGVLGRNDKGVVPFVSYAGLISSLSFLVVILMLGASMIFLDPCRLR